MNRRAKLATSYPIQGFSLLEILIALLIVGIVASMALPNSVTLVRYELRHGAVEQMRRVRGAEAQLAICAAQQISCPAVAVQIPPAGTLTTGGYQYQYASNPDGSAWTYTASPLDDANASLYTDQSGVIRISYSGTATASSQAIQ